MIQYLDSLKLARDFSSVCQNQGVEMDVLIEVNIGREESKSGVAPEVGKFDCRNCSITCGSSIRIDKQFHQFLKRFQKQKIFQICTKNSLKGQNIR